MVSKESVFLPNWAFVDWIPLLLRAAWYFRLFLTKTKQDQAHQSLVYGKIWTHFWLWFLGPGQCLSGDHFQPKNHKQSRMLLGKIFHCISLETLIMLSICKKWPKKLFLDICLFERPSRLIFCPPTCKALRASVQMLLRPPYSLQAHLNRNPKTFSGEQITHSWSNQTIFCLKKSCGK